MKRKQKNITLTSIMKELDQQMDIQHLINSYIDFVKSCLKQFKMLDIMDLSCLNEITFKQIGEYYKITFPILDTANDYLEIYVKPEKDDIYITDDGYIINSLEMRGIKVIGEVKDIIEKNLSQNIKLNGNELIAKSSVDLFGITIHCFITALLKIDSLFNF